MGNSHACSALVRDIRREHPVPWRWDRRRRTTSGDHCRRGARDGSAVELPLVVQRGADQPEVGLDAQLLAVKDSTVVRYNNKWHVFASTASSTGGYNMMYTSFVDRTQAASTRQFYLDRLAVGAGDRAAPQVFYFAPKNQWYRVYQTGLPSFSTTRHQQSRIVVGTPKLSELNALDCPAEHSPRLRGGFLGRFRQRELVSVLLHRHGRVPLEQVRTVGSSNQYLLVVEAIGGNGKRYFRSWTANGITGSWLPH